MATFTSKTTLGELFEAAAKANGTVIEPENWDVTIKELQAELSVVLKDSFDAWYENRVMKIKSYRGIPRTRFVPVE